MPSARAARTKAWGIVVAGIQVPPVVERQTKLGPERLPEPVLLNPRVAVANPLRIVAFQQLQCLNSTNVVFAVGDEVNVVTVLCEQADGGLEVSEEPEATEGKQNSHEAQTRRYRLPSSHLQKGAQKL
jgi:hypothetical protein